MGSKSLVKSEQANKSNPPHFPVAGAPLQAARTARRPPGARQDAAFCPPPRPSPSDLPRSPGPGSAASARRPPPLPSARHPAAGRSPRRGPSSRGGLCRPSSRPSGLQPAAHVQGGRREEEGRGGRKERGEGGRQAREGELLGARTSQSQPGARTQRLSGSPPRPAVPHLPPAPPGVPLAPSLQQLLRPGQRPPPSPSRPHPQLCGLTPGTRVLAPSFLPSCLPSRPPALSRSPSRVAIVSVPSALRRRLALPRLPLALPESPAAAAPTPARGARGREKWASAPSPSPAPQPCPAREDREDEQRQQSREGEHPERGQPSGGRGTERLGAGAGTTWDGGRGLCPECGWVAGRPAGRGSRGAGLRWGRGTEGLGIAPARRRSPRLRPRDEGVSSESVFWWVHARLRA